MDILKIYLISFNNKKSRLAVLLILVLLGTFLETLSIGLLIPLLGLIVNEISAIQTKISEIFTNIPFILNYLLSLDKYALIVLSLIIIAISFTFKTFFLIFVGWFSARFIYDIHRKLSKTLFSSYLNRPYSFFLNKNSSELMRNTTGEVGVFVGQVLIPLVYLFTELTVVIFLSIFLLYIEPVGTSIVFLLFSTFIFFSNYLTKNMIFRWGKLRQSETGMVIKTLQESFGAIKEVKLFNFEKEFIDKFHKHNASANLAESNLMAFQNVPRYGIEYFAVICFVGFVFFFVYSGKDFNLLIPLLAIYAATAFRLLPSVNRIVMNINALRYGLPVIKIIKSELLTAKNQIPNEDNALKDINFDSIEFDNVNFGYIKNGNLIFKDLSFQISKGDVIGIYGPSGCGKSTLVDLICGLIIQNSGQIKVNKIRIEEIKKSWQAILGYVPQSPFFFDDKIKTNIGFSFNENKLDENKILEKIKQVELDQFIQNLPNGINTEIGEKGTRISGGQKQRIAIARALYKNSQLLIMDEATSALDVDVEDKIINSINKIKKNMTILLISHRKSSLKICNKIFKLDGSGQVKVCKFEEL